MANKNQITIIVLIACAVVFVSSLVYSASVTRKLYSYEVLKDQAKFKDKEFDQLSKKTDDLYKQLEEIENREDKIRKMLGFKPIKRKWGFIDLNKAKKPKGIENRINDLRNKEFQKKTSLNNLYAMMQKMRARFAFTPSIWPAYGRVMSTFGYRAYPWRGFHAGVDINNNYGTPIRCTADGTVSYAGWRTGYGKTVIVNHGWGLETLYGHTSRFVVKAGQKVKKGQLIAYIGTTGYVTGPHVHYEVIKNGTAINPMGYLDLKLFSANN